MQRSISRHATDDYLLLMEHPPVYTLGRHADTGHVLVDPSAVGAELVPVDRGGDVTYHGPGQLIGYPLVTVGPGPHHGRSHVERVEQVVIDALVSLGLAPTAVGRLPGYPGVWVGLDDDPGHGSGGPRKIAAIGVRTSRGRTTHGFALNVTTDLSMFDHIVPCGIADRPVTSLAAEGLSVTMTQVRAAVVAAAERVWGPTGDVQAVTDGAASGSVHSVGPPPGAVAVSLGRRDQTSPLERRLVRAGVDPDAGVALDQRKPAVAPGPDHHGGRLPGSPTGAAGPRSDHGVRRGRLPQHLRMLVRRDCHLHDQWIPLHPGLRILPGGHPPSAPAGPRRARAGGRGGPADGSGPRRHHLCGPRRPGRRGRRRVRRHHRRHPEPYPPHHHRGPDLGLQGGRAVPAGHLRCPSGRAQPQHRDGGPAAAGRPALGRLRPQPRRAGPGRRTPD